ncbi:hypothetical protein DK926_17430 [Rhodococcus sp. Eu-32]|uniref:Rv2629 family ribosome hibernation factor n=1 Tax=Rhodococcus sp. Eu-32 TaxID=1017319 RepID=UPI000DF3F3D6|nr:hypothetical protein [Rhodococcus sp. Eu-32]RRQ26586.1 hypothetical protein DK926_17430 [Rhodococcus sp. Eu-32]
MQTHRFRALVDEPGPFATVYYDDTHTSEDASAVAELTARAVIEELEERGADASLTGAIETAMTVATPPSGPSGRVVIAGRNGVLVDEHLVRPAVKTEVRVSDLPYLVPIVEHGAESVAYAVALVDHQGADLTLHSEDGDTWTTSVDGDGYPVHKASSAETAGYGDPQPRAEEAARKNIRAVAAELDTAVDRYDVGVVFLGGDVRARAELLEHVADRVRERAVTIDGASRSAGVDTQATRDKIDEEFARRRLAAVDAAVQRFQQYEGTGRAAQGIEGVSSALRSGNVDTLIVGDLGQRTVVSADGLVAADVDALSEYGASDAQTVPADEAVVAAAVRVGASIVRTDERFTPEDGVAAVLRYDEFSSADAGVR